VYHKCNQREQLVKLLDEIASRPRAAALDVALIHAALGNMDGARIPQSPEPLPVRLTVNGFVSATVNSQSLS